jgi:hypothetical protein
VKYAFKIKQTDIFEMVGNILLYQKDTKQHEVFSRTDHPRLPASGTEQ